MALTMKLSASLFLVLFFSIYSVSGDSSSNSEEDEIESSVAQPIPSLNTAAAKLNLFNLISPGQPTASEEEESGPFMTPQLQTISTPTEKEEEEEGGAGVHTTQTPLPEIVVPLQPIQLPIPRVPLPPAPIPQRPFLMPLYRPYFPAVRPPPGIITISSPPVQVGNPAIPRPIAPLYPMASVAPTRPLPQTPPSDDIYCIMSTGDCVPTNSICINGVMLNSFCSGPSRSCCILLNSNRTFGL